MELVGADDQAARGEEKTGARFGGVRALQPISINKNLQKNIKQIATSTNPLLHELAAFLVKHEHG